MPINKKMLVRAEQLLKKIDSNCADCITRHAGGKPDTVAFIMQATGREITWRQFDASVNAYAASLRSPGLKKGDIVATILTLTEEHIDLIYACCRLSSSCG